MINDCWEYDGCRCPKGYGQARWQGKAQRVHRVVFIEWYGYAPPVVRHTCDNPACYNPHHLEGGTHADNTQDMMERGRHKAGPGAPVLNPGMPDLHADAAAYYRELRFRQRAGTWNYRTPAVID